MPVDPIPAGYPTIIPYLIVPDAAKLIDFLKAAFGAAEVRRTSRADGTIMHAEVTIGDSRIMMGEASEQWKAMPGSIHLYVADCDATYARAMAAGAASVFSPMNQFYGDRMGGVRDHTGTVWWIATHIEDVSDEEIARRQGAAQQAASA